MGHSVVSLANNEFDSAHQALRNTLEELFPSPIVIRSQVTKQSKGLISSRTLANYDSSSKGKGVPERFKLNGKVCYDRDIFIGWLIKRIIHTKKNIAPSVKRAYLDDFLQ